METQETDIQKIPGNEAIWDGIKLAYTQVQVINPENLGKDKVVNGLFTFCPLYDKSSLEESQLILPPAEISDSRVTGKWEADKKVVSALADGLAAQGRQLVLTVVLADKGVLLNHKPTEDDYKALSYHASLYKSALVAFCVEKGIPVQFIRYQDDMLGVEFSDFVNPNAEIPNLAKLEGQERRNVADATDPQAMLLLLKEYMASLDVDVLDTINTKMRETVKELMKSFTPNVTFWMVAGYLAFDHKIPGLLGEGGVYISTERFDPIFKITRLTPSLRAMTRIEIKA